MLVNTCVLIRCVKYGGYCFGPCKYEWASNYCFGFYNYLKYDDLRKKLNTVLTVLAHVR
jgi:hypothetical protein